MITKAEYQNFKALREVKIAFDSRLMVLVGPNGSGKTSVLQGLYLAAELARGRDKRVGFDPRFRAHELTATNDADDKSPKRALRSLTNGDPDRERACVFSTSLETLRTRGKETGLAEFLDELSTNLVEAFR